MSISKAYVANKAFAQPYIHYRKESYTKTPVNTEEMANSSLELYKEQSKRLVENFRRNELPNSTKEEAAKTLETLEGIVTALTKTSAFQEQTKNINVFTNDLYKVNNKSFYSYSLSETKRKELFSDADMLGDFVEKLGGALESFRTTSVEEKKAIMQEMERGRFTIPTKNALSGVTIIEGDSKADIGLKKLIASVELLESYVDPFKKKYRSTGYTPVNIGDRDAEEIVRTLAGSMSGLKGGFFEVAVDHLANNLTSDLMDEIKELAKTKDFTITGSTLEGSRTKKTEGDSEKKFVSKTDIKIGIQLDKNSAALDVGLSLKTSSINKLTKTRRTTLVSGANLGDLLSRSNSILDASTYHIANIAAHGISTSTNVYKAAKMRATALMALDAMSGLGTKADTSYFIMYLDKVVNISTFLEGISQGSIKDIPLSTSLEGIGSMKDRIQLEAKKYKYIERYIRSKEAFDLIMNGIKVTINSTTST